MELLTKVVKGQQFKGRHGGSSGSQIQRREKVGNSGSEVSSIVDTRLFNSKAAAEAAAAFLNNGLDENHLGRASAERVS